MNVWGVKLAGKGDRIVIDPVLLTDWAGSEVAGRTGWTVCRRHRGNHC